MTTYQAIKSGKYALVSAWADNTIYSLPALFYFDGGEIHGENSEIGHVHGWINGRQLNAHINNMIKEGFSVTIWGDAETAREMLSRADDDARRAQALRGYN